LNRANKVELGPLPLNDISLYYDAVFKKLGKSIIAEVLDYAVNSTLGYPYLLQLVGYYVLEYAAENLRIELETVAKAVISAKRDMIDSIFITSLNPLSQQDKKFLQGLALQGDQASISTIREHLEVSQASVQQTRARLLDSGIITAPRRGEVALALPYLGAYLRGEF
jgi:DNA-binding transcriptional ArsR family regulator